MKRKFLEAVIRKSGDNFCHYAAAPKFFAQPVTNLGGVPENIFADVDSDSTDSCTINLNAKIAFRLVSSPSFKKNPRVLDAVRIREAIA